MDEGILRTPDRGATVETGRQKLAPRSLKLPLPQ